MTDFLSAHDAFLAANREQSYAEEAERRFGHLKKADLPVLAAVAQGCRLHYHYRAGFKFSRAPSSSFTLNHPDGRWKFVSSACRSRLEYQYLIETADREEAFGASLNYTLTAKGLSRAAECTKSIDEIFKRVPPVAPAAPAAQETT